MNSKTFKLITIMFIIIISLTSCSAEYSKQVKEYETLYDNTMNLLDSKKVYESIKDNNLTLNLEQLDKLLKKIEEDVPNNKIHDFMVLRTEHDILKNIIEKGLKWDSLGDFERFTIKDSIDTLRPQK